MRCFFTSDLHGSVERYLTLFERIDAERPDAVFLGGDLLPMHFGRVLIAGSAGDFMTDVVAAGFERLRGALGAQYPEVLLILGNDDGRFDEASVVEWAKRGLWTYLQGRSARLGDVTAYGYAYVPPTPFLLKDWERYDVSRYVDPGAVSPEEGRRSVEIPAHEIRYATIKEDLERLAGEDDMTRAVFLFHSPPHSTKLDRADLDGRSVDHVPLDPNVGSIAIRRFIEARQPLLTLHGHVHEAARLTGSWRDRIGRTHLLGAAHDGPELALVRFDLDALEDATRELL